MRSIRIRRPTPPSSPRAAGRRFAAPEFTPERLAAPLRAALADPAALARAAAAAKAAGVADAAERLADVVLESPAAQPELREAADAAPITPFAAETTEGLVNRLGGP